MTMDQWTLLNIEMDHLAKAHMRIHGTTPVPNHKFSHERVTVSVSGAKLSCFNKQALYTQLHGHYKPFDPSGPKKEWPALEFWKARDNIPSHLLSSIHWVAHGKAIRGLPFGKQRWLSKHALGQCAVGHMALQRKWQDHSECPLCQQPDETTHHVIQCTDARADVCWNLQLQQLNQWLQERSTVPEISQVIISRLNAWRKNQPLLPLQVSPAVQAALDKQDQVGWWNFLMGRVITNFAEIQTQHFQALGWRRTGRTWLSALIRQLWDISFTMWEHRNQVLHGDMTPRKLQLLRHLQQQAQEQFDEGTNGLLPEDHHWLQDREAVLALDLMNLQLWHKSITLAREAYEAHIHSSRKRLTNARAFMRNWLNQRQQPPHLVPPQPQQD